MSESKAKMKPTTQTSSATAASSTLSSSGSLSVSSSYIGTLTSAGIASAASSATYYPKSYYSTYAWDDGETSTTVVTSRKLSEEDIKEIIKKIFDGDTDLLPLVKNYLIKYLDTVMDNPDEIVKELIKEKDEEINNLKKEVEDLGEKIKELEKKVSSTGVLDDWAKISTSPGTDVTWIGGDSTWTTSTTSNISSSTILGPGDNYTAYYSYSDGSGLDSSMGSVSQTSYDALANKITAKLNSLKNSPSKSG